MTHEGQVVHSSVVHSSRRKGVRDLTFNMLTIIAEPLALYVLDFGKPDTSFTFSNSLRIQSSNLPNISKHPQTYTSRNKKASEMENA